MKPSIVISHLIIALLLISQFSVIAQTKIEAKGDKLMAQYHYAAATEAFTKALQDDDADRIKLKLAQCYRKLNDPENTSRWYNEIIENESIIKPIDKYYYAMALTEQGDMLGAKKWFEAYSIDEPDDERSKNYVAQLDDVNSLYKDSSLYMLKTATFNSLYSDFSPTYYKNAIVFISGRSQSSGKYKWDESSYLDLYISHRNSLGIFSQAAPFHKNVNTKFHEGPVSFYDNGKKLVLTRNNSEKGKLNKSSEGITKLNLYFTSIDSEGNWSEVDPFIYNNDEYSVGHPSITEDGNTIYFVSDMPGGHGGTDIYVSQKNADGWSEPQNLGATVNTKGNEMFPYFHGNGMLFFSSNGLGGLGGLDIFKYDIAKSELSNYGYPINSTKDDFGFIVDEDNKIGFLASNRDSENGVDNIYQFEYVKPTLYDISVSVVDAISLKPIPNASIEVDEFGSKANRKFRTDSSGIMMIPMELRHQYNVKASKKGFESSAQYLVPKNSSETMTLKIAKECTSVRGLVQLSTGENAKDISILLVNLDNSEKESMWVANNEYYEFCIEPSANYSLRIEKKDYFAQTIKFTSQDDQPIALENIELNKIEIDKAIKLDNIYYDLGKSNIRSDAARELDKLVKLLKDNPTIEIELSSHTDSRGSDVYNLNLSIKRANSAVDYIRSQGVENSRIEAKGYGEIQLLNKCSNGVSCTAEEHQANRRTEFKVLRY